MEDVHLPNGMTIKAEDMALAETWVNVAADILSAAPEMADELRLAVDNIAKAANSRYELLEQGGFVSFDRDDLDGALGMYDEDVQTAFLDCTADLLMAAQDGPIATAVHLRTAINSMEEKGGRL